MDTDKLEGDEAPDAAPDGAPPIDPDEAAAERDTSGWYDTPEPVEHEPFESIPWFPNPVIVDEREWVEMWSRGGENALVTVFPTGYEPNPRHVIGMCTIARYLEGLTPYDIEIAIRIPNLLRNARGIDVHRVTRLPRTDDILTLFTGHLPSSEDDRPLDGRPRMPKRLHIPRWQILNVRREYLEPVGGAFHGMPVQLNYEELKPITYSSGRSVTRSSAVLP